MHEIWQVNSFDNGGCKRKYYANEVADAPLIIHYLLCNGSGVPATDRLVFLNTVVDDSYIIHTIGTQSSVECKLTSWVDN